MLNTRLSFPAHRISDNEVYQIGSRDPPKQATRDFAMMSSSSISLLAFLPQSSVTKQSHNSPTPFTIDSFD